MNPDGGTFQITWEGPGGSGIEFHVYGEYVRCQIPEDVDWGSCQALTHATPFGGTGPKHVCRMLDPSPPNLGQGRCRAVHDL